MNLLELLRDADRKLDTGEITIGEYEKMIAPLKDAVPVVHGRWIKSSRDYDCIVCSECGTRCGTEPFGYGHYLSDFCPSCGADMRKDGDQNG